VDYCWEPGQIEAGRTILSRLRQLQPDVVWFNLGATSFGRSPLVNLAGLLSAGAVRRMGLPTVVTLHEVVELADLPALHAPGGPFAHWGARLLTKIATHADVVCLTMRQYVELLSARNLDCVYIPIGAYHEPEFLEPSASLELLFFTTLAPFKGLELLLDAFPGLLADFPRLRLTVAGAEHVRFPEYARRMKSTFDEAPGVSWLGQVAEEDVKSLFQRASVVVLPYAASTGSSSVLYQAATWGRPIVTSDLHEIRQLVSENDFQVQWFPRGDAAALRTAIGSILGSPGFAREQALHNLETIRREPPGQTASRYVGAFNRALEKRNCTKRIAVPQAKPELT